MPAASQSRRCRSCGRFKAAGTLGDLCAACSERLQVEAAPAPRPVEPPPPPPAARPVLEPGVVIPRPSQLHHGGGVLHTLGPKSPAAPGKAPRRKPPLSSLSVRERLLLVVVIGVLAGIVVAFLLSR
jgi:hypothetical protein